MNDYVMLCAGGTGGHLFPAEALARALLARGIAVELATDQRAGSFAGSFPARAIHSLPAGTPSGGGIIAKIVAGARLMRGTFRARSIMRKHRPLAVVGFGGYPSVPGVMAAHYLKIPIILHEQNAVMGRANRFLAPHARRIATGFAMLGQEDPRYVHVGNPLRPAVLAAASRAYEPLLPGERLHLLVFGGSQGARIMADVVPAAIERLNGAERERIALVQQARQEDIGRVREIYTHLGVSAEVAPFFKDMPERMAWSHLIVARAGASSVAEIAAIGRASLLVPLPGAIDQDQAANARSLAAIGAAQAVAQAEFTPESLAKALKAALADPSSLTRAAEAAKTAGIVDAAERLAALVLDAARRS